MKLLVFSPYYPPHIGGLESHSDEFNKYLSQKGVDITVFTPRLPQDAPESEIRHNGVKIIRFPAFEIIPNYPLLKFWKLKFWQLFLGLFKQKFDITISRTRFFSTSILALIYAKIKGTKWIHIEHGSDFVQLSSKFKTFLAKIYDYTLGNLVFKFSDQNISISKAVQKFVYKFDKRESLIIYRGIDIGEIEKIAPDYNFKKLYEDKIIIAWAGRLYKWKGVKNSIEAIKSLPAEIKSKIVFVVMGDGEDLTGLKKIADDTVVFTGSLPREKVIGILKVANIYIHSSEPGGGLSTSLLEAMACGCAVIATPNEGANEIIEDGKNGAIIRNNSLEEIAKATTNLVSSEEKRKRYTLNCQKLIQEKFNWDYAISKYLECFGK